MRLERLRGMTGPLGCTPSATVLPDPPRGCFGTLQIVAEVKRQMEQVWWEAGCGTEPPDESAYVAAYEEDFAARHDFVQHELQRDGFRIVAREFGAEHREAGPTIVLMHGFPDNLHLYDLVAPTLGETHHALTFDFVGFGLSDIPGPDYEWPVEGLRRDLEAVLAALASERVVVVVHDASGWPGIDWALDNPDRVAGLVLLNTFYHPIPGVTPPQVIRALSALDLRDTYVESLGDDDILGRAMFLTQVGRFFRNRARRELILPLFAHSEAREARFGLTGHLLDEVIARTTELDRMAEYPRPVRVVFGEDDPYLNVAVARGFREAFPGSELTLVPRASHYVQIDAPEIVIEKILEVAD